jgi:hypothetical protein
MRWAALARAAERSGATGSLVEAWARQGAVSSLAEASARQPGGSLGVVTWWTPWRARVLRAAWWKPRRGSLVEALVRQGWCRAPWRGVGVCASECLCVWMWELIGLRKKRLRMKQ